MARHRRRRPDARRDAGCLRCRELPDGAVRRPGPIPPRRWPRGRRARRVSAPPVVRTLLRGQPGAPRRHPCPAHVPPSLRSGGHDHRPARWHQLRSTALVLPHRPPPDAAQSPAAGAGGDAPAPHGATSAVPLGTATLAAGGRTRVYTCDAHKAACASYDTSGARRGEFVLPLVRLKMTGGHWRAAVREHRLEDPTRWARPILEKVLNEVPPPRGLPLIDRVRVDADDNLWARTLDNYLSPVATWVVVSPEGRLLRLVATPRALLLRDLGPDYLLGVTEDQDGVEEVRLYRRPAAEGVSGSGTRPPAAVGRSASRPR